MKKANIALFVLAAILAIYQMAVGQTITQDTAYYRNGSVMQLNTYANDVRIERCFYYPTGELQLYQEFDHATGLQIGDEYWWYRNGQVEHACEWENGYTHGWALTWDAEGELISSQVFVESHIVPTEDYGKYFSSDEVNDETDSDDQTGIATRR
jgi:antitoxin component YwqK of YwqJK toxin-antitoxin module